MSIENLTCVVSGSFEKAKGDIDRTINEFTALKVKVLAPDLGWIAKPRWEILTPSPGFRPLPTEADMSIKAIENNFLLALRNSDFEYLENVDGYVGDTAAMEMGFAIACGVRIFSRFAINPLQDLDPIWRERIKEVIVATPEEVVSFFEGVLLTKISSC